MKLFFKKFKDKFGVNWIFLFVVLFVYAIIWIFNQNLFLAIWKDFLNVFFKQILAVLLIVFIFMFVLNILLQKDTIKDKIQNSSNNVKYIVSIFGGILSTGPVYMWYPFLKKLKDHGLNYGHIASFIYARVIKIPFLAVMVFYFGLKYTIIFNLVLLVLALLIWIIINLIFNYFDYEKNNS